MKIRARHPGRFVARWFSVTLLLLAAFMQGCPLPQKFDIYNDSSQDLVVLFKDAPAAWPRGTVLQIRHEELQRVQWVNLSPEMTSPVLDVAFSGERFRYSLGKAFSVRPPYESGVKSDIKRLQIRSDKRLYAVSPLTAFATSIDEQPQDFPLEPVELRDGQ